MADEEPLPFNTVGGSDMRNSPTSPVFGGARRLHPFIAWPVRSQAHTKALTTWRLEQRPITTTALDMVRLSVFKSYPARVSHSSGNNTDHMSSHQLKHVMSHFASLALNPLNTTGLLSLVA